MAGREDDGADRLPERSRRTLEWLKDARERVPSSARDLDDDRSAFQHWRRVARALPGTDAPGKLGPETLREAITPPRMGEPA